MKRYLHLFAILLLPLAAVKAQKLPNKQEASVWAPNNLKIDGKTTEWNDRFQAYYQNNHIYYTLSNDDDNLYLTVRMDDILGSRKILKGGLTFTVTPLSKTADKLSITFPVIPKNNQYLEETQGSPLLNYTRLTTDTIANKAKIDSLVSFSNNFLRKFYYKQIMVKGIPGTSEPFLSIDNTQGILVAASFDKKMRYTYELAIPLKYLKGAISNLKGINYNIKLSAEPPVQVQESSSLAPKVDHLVLLGPEPMNMDILFIESDSNFSGAYTLAKK